ncbi:hypothetical protein FA95DRAFT_1613897 [Auriscalpium vulgare]|uniref:Uncharacterized protein n=1 Tax=Auriscalpium vulgare TaxID=40419 RepID=A0ACB8R2K2_9AGAM|nr:hypothetical protein FA95DRAFT_1613897 [Auriscalpium vulgare]
MPVWRSSLQICRSSPWPIASYLYRTAQAFRRPIDVGMQPVKTQAEMIISHFNTPMCPVSRRDRLKVRFSEPSPIVLASAALRHPASQQSAPATLRRLTYSNGFERASDDAPQTASLLSSATALFRGRLTEGEAWLLKASRTAPVRSYTFLGIRPLKPSFINHRVEGGRLAHLPASALLIAVPAPVQTLAMSDAPRASDSRQSPNTTNPPRPLPPLPGSPQPPDASPSPEEDTSAGSLTLYYVLKMGPSIRMYDNWDELVSALSRGASCHYDVYTNLMDACNAWLHALQPHFADAAAWALTHQRDYWEAHGLDKSVPVSPPSASPPPPTPAATDASLEKSESSGERLAAYFHHGQHVDVTISRTIHVEEEPAADETASASVETYGHASPRSLSPPAFMAPPSPALLAGSFSSPSADSLGGFSLQGMIRRARVDSATPGNVWYGVVRGFTTGVLQGPYEYMVADAAEGYDGAFYRGFQERRAAVNWYREHRYD